MKRENYPDDWEALSIRIRDRALWMCEGSPAYPDCRAAQNRPHPITGSRVILTVGHLDHDTTHNDPANLRAWCQRCHLTHDAKHHAKNAAITRRERQIENGQVEMPL